MAPDFERFMDYLKRVPEGQPDVVVVLEFVSFCPSILLMRYARDFVVLIKKFKAINVITRLVPLMSQVFRPFVNELFAFLGQSEMNVETVRAMVTIANHFAEVAPDVVEEFLRIAELFEEAIRGILIIVSANAIGRMAVPLLEFCLARLSKKYILEIVYWLLHRHDLSYLHSSIRNLLIEHGIKLDNFERAISGRDDLRCWIPPFPFPVLQMRPLLSGMEVKAKSNFLDFFKPFKRTTVDVENWFRQLMDCCLSSQRNVFLAVCRPIAERCAVVNREVFNIAFHANCVSLPRRRHQKFTEKYQEVGDQLLAILKSKKTPSAVAIALSNLIEFMDRAAFPVVPLVKLTPQHLHSHLPFRLKVVLSKMDLPADMRPTREQLACAYFDVGLLEEWHQFAGTDWSDESWLVTKSAFPEAITKALSDPSPDFIARAFEEIGRVGGPQFMQGSSTILTSIVGAQILTEIQELSSDNFRIRLRKCADVFNVIYPILLLRIESKPHSDDEKALFLHLARQGGEWVAFERYFNKFFGDFESAPFQVKLDYVKYLWSSDSGHQQALALCDSIKENDERLVYRRALFKTRLPRPLDNLRDCADSLNNFLDHRGCHRVWAWINWKLFEREPIETYRRAAALAFSKCVASDPRARISHLLQMLSLILDHSGDAQFDDAVMDSIPLEYYLPVLNHIIPRRNSPRALSLVDRIFERFPYQAVFPILYAMKSDRTRDDHQY
jgi:hypothetical protein